MILVFMEALRMLVFMEMQQQELRFTEHQHTFLFMDLIVQQQESQSLIFMTLEIRQDISFHKPDKEAILFLPVKILLASTLFQMVL